MFFDPTPFSKISKSYDFEWCPRGSNVRFIIEQAGPYKTYIASYEVGLNKLTMKRYELARGNFKLTQMIDLCVQSYALTIKRNKARKAKK